ncbi:Tail Collar domain protein [Gluconacetobacter diazotrophicus PA1 5]|nr:Tail Collar domain protein [Gluconacetobacter diazotrophicus PA1 5]TWA98217.1 tail collar domain [Gluconacetobacter diazotrophicus]
MPRAGAQLFFYQTGTTTPQATYADAALSVPNTNPVIADENGQFGNIFLLGAPAYAVVLEDANGDQIWTMDPVGPGAASGVAGSVPVGLVADFAGGTAPAGWMLCYGQAISRATYAALFAVIDTTFGAGDGATTFGLPDLRGRVAAGVDNMGGTAANLLTMAGSSVNGVALGASGGSQIMASHTHTVTDPGHTHTVTDPGHEHAPNSGSGFVVPQGSGGTIVTFDGGSLTPEHATETTSVDTTGVTLETATAGITVGSTGTGTSQNVQPTVMLNKIIYTGVGG